MLRRTWQGPDSRAFHGISGPNPRRNGHGRPAGKAALLALVAVVAFGLAGFLFYRAYQADPTIFSTNLQKQFNENAPFDNGGPLTDEQIRAQVQAQVAGKGTNLNPPVLDPSVASGDALVIKTPVAFRKGPGGKPMVVLGAPAGPNAPSFNRTTQLGLLAREIVRQAFAMAAIEGLGLTVRDDSLGDPEAKDASTSAAATFSTLFPTEKPGKLSLKTKQGSSLFARDLAALGFEGQGYQDLVVQAESLADKEFPELIHALGPEGKPVAWSADAKVPAEAEDALTKVDDVSQFAAIRAIHEAIRKDGESPARLGALSRAYAIQGILTEQHYSPEHKVLKARALLYAQRMARKAPGSSLALRHRAFAEALAGMHREASADLAAGSKLAGANEPAPTWLPILEGYLTLNPKLMQPVAPGDPDTALAALLRLHSVEFPSNHPRVSDAAKQLLGVEPGCSLAYHMLNKTNLIQALHFSTAAGIVGSDRVGLNRVRKIPGFPAPLAEAIKNSRSIDKAAEALRDPELAAGDTGEPSAAAIARSIADARLVQVADRIRFLAFQLSAPYQDEFARLQPLIAGHRYERAFALFTGKPGAAEEVRAFTEGFPHDNFDLSYFSLLGMATRGDPILKTPTVQLGEAHLDPIYHDVGVLLDDLGSVGWGLSAMTLYRINPSSPYATAKMIEQQAPGMEEKVPSFLSEPGTDPMVLNAIANRARQAKDYPRAVAALERIGKESPSVRNCLELGDTYEKMNRPAEAEKAYEAGLALPDEGLAHAQMAVKIANSMMARDQFKKARPFAERAAQSYAAWAMICAIECYEGLGLWDDAIEWIERHRDRYGSDPFAYLRFCLRTGHGDRDKAIAEAKALLPQIPDNFEALILRAEVAALTGDAAKAVALYKSGLRNLPDTAFADLADIALSDQVGEKAERDQAIQRVRAPEMKSRGAKILGLVSDGLKGADPIALDLAAIDGTLKEMWLMFHRRWRPISAGCSVWCDRGVTRSTRGGGRRWTSRSSNTWTSRPATTSSSRSSTPKASHARDVAAASTACTAGTGPRRWTIAAAAAAASSTLTPAPHSRRPSGPHRTCC